jgi:hypothetical protein
VRGVAAPLASLAAPARCCLPSPRSVASSSQPRASLRAAAAAKAATASASSPSSHMSDKRVLKAFKAKRYTEGAGFVVRRPIGAASPVSHETLPNSHAVRANAHAAPALTRTAALLPALRAVSVRQAGLS